MYYQFGKLSIDGTQVVQLVNRGGTYKNTSFGLNSPDQAYIDAGLIPIEGDSPGYDPEKQTISMSYDITPELITRAYTLTDIPLEDRKIALKKKVSEAFAANTRPKVEVTLEDSSLIAIDGGREDKDNFKEKYEKMIRLSETTTTIRDAFDGYHTVTVNDMQTCWQAIVDNFDNALAAKWSKEQEIDACTTLEEINAITI